MIFMATWTPSQTIDDRERQMATNHSAWVFPADASSVRLARAAVTAILGTGGWDEEGIDDAALMTSELATNAVMHARSSYTLSIDLDGSHVRVEVRDASAEPPRVSHVDPLGENGGRGLAIVDAIADRWGSEPNIYGKAVWFEQSRVW